MNGPEQENELNQYPGSILQGKYSAALKNRVQELITAFSKFDLTGVPGIPYITAWNHNNNLMWYEFAGRQLTDLFGCGVRELAGVFREAVVDHRILHRTEVEAGIRETARNRQELSGIRKGLRAEVAESGNVEAVYKVLLAGDMQHVWLKDRARVETFATERISVSFGFLTDVTNEMEHKDLLEKIGYFDQLTNLPNRIIMHRSLELKIAEYERNHIDDFVFLLMDIDHFKAVNDNYGHRAGDYILATLAQVLKDVKRRSDEVGRFGGEEFYGVALGDIFEGREFAERVRRRVEVTPFVYDEQMIPLTLSIGIVAASELMELTEENLIEATDRRLYRAKQYGRNQVVSETIAFK
jgi:diguanylate cyclase (GGDEF)-like protein